jgi:hypothetical protein
MWNTIRVGLSRLGIGQPLGGATPPIHDIPQRIPGFRFGTLVKRFGVGVGSRFGEIFKRRF